VLLLGPGGRTVYLGPASRAKEYFQALGFPFPADANPIDVIMEIIAGDVPRNGDPDFKATDLFEFWVAHTARERAARADKLTANSSAFGSDAELSSSPAGGYSSGTPPQRKLPGLPLLVFLCTVRAFVQITRNLGLFLLDNLLVFVAGLFLGIMYGDQNYVPPPPPEISKLCPDALKFRCELPIYDPIINASSMIVLALSLTTIMASLRVFGSDRVVYWREVLGLILSIFFFTLNEKKKKREKERERKREREREREKDRDNSNFFVHLISFFNSSHRFVQRHLPPRNGTRPRSSSARTFRRSPVSFSPPRSF
jgi:hypothetical protein